MAPCCQLRTTILLLTACFSGLIMVWYLTAMHLERYDAFIDKRASRAEERLEEVKQGMKDASA